MAILAPTVPIVQVADVSLLTLPLDSAEKALPKLIREAPTRLKWHAIALVPYEQAVSAQKEVLGEHNLESRRLNVRDLDRVARALDVRYVAYFTVKELGSYTSDRLVYKSKTGRATIALLVYDAQAKKYVWVDERTETSTRQQWLKGESLRERQDQALYNAVRKSLEPFVLEGRRRVVQTPAVGILATVQRIVKGGRQVVLNVGEASGLRTGETMRALDGGCRVRVVEVYGNGTLAEVLDGRPRESDVFMTSEG